MVLIMGVSIVWHLRKARISIADHGYSFAGSVILIDSMLQDY
jgi:hypothetical protein